MLTEELPNSQQNELWAWNQEGGKAPAAHATGCTLDVRDVSYSVYLNDKYKRLLRNVNLHLEPVSDFLYFYIDSFITACCANTGRYVCTDGTIWCWKEYTFGFNC